MGKFPIRPSSSSVVLAKNGSGITLDNVKLLKSLLVTVFVDECYLMQLDTEQVMYVPL